MGKNLIIYFSRKGQNYVNGSIVDLKKGNTEMAAEFIRTAVGGDLFEVETLKPYAEDYRTCTVEAKAELRGSARPKLKKYIASLDGYENIFVCGPCWWGTYPMPVLSLLERLDWTGKKVLPLMTHEGSGLGSAERTLKSVCAGAIIVKGLAVHGAETARRESEIAAWAQKNV